MHYEVPQIVFFFPEIEIYLKWHAKKKSQDMQLCRISIMVVILSQYSLLKYVETLIC
jgi:hypothetical protein